MAAYVKSTNGPIGNFGRLSFSGLCPDEVCNAKEEETAFHECWESNAIEIEQKAKDRCNVTEEETLFGNTCLNEAAYIEAVAQFERNKQQ